MTAEIHKRWNLIGIHSLCFDPPSSMKALYADSRLFSNILNTNQSETCKEIDPLRTQLTKPRERTTFQLHRTECNFCQVDCNCIYLPKPSRDVAHGGDVTRCFWAKGECGACAINVESGKCPWRCPAMTECVVTIYGRRKNKLNNNNNDGFKKSICQWDSPGPLCKSNTETVRRAIISRWGSQKRR